MRRVSQSLLIVFRNTGPPYGFTPPEVHRVTVYDVDTSTTVKRHSESCGPRAETDVTIE